MEPVFQCVVPFGATHFFSAFLGMAVKGTIMDKHENSTAFGFDHSNLHTYSGYLKNKEKLLKSASGGAITAIAEEIIRRGGVVFGASYSIDFKRSEYCCVDNLADLDRLKGSKYCITKKEIVQDGQAKSVYSVLETMLAQNRLILFVGLGCDVAAVAAYCKAKKLNTDRLFLIDILCHGPTAAAVHTQYVENLEKQYRSKITAFHVRYKKDGWTPPYIRAEFENGKIHELPFYRSDYGFAFIHYALPFCYQCRFRGDNHKGDMICGDFWGLTDSMSGWNKNGVSIMFVRTERGQTLINMIDRDNYHIEEVDTAFALQNNHMYYECRKKWEHYDTFGKDLEKEGLRYALTHFPISKREHITRFIKRLLPKRVKLYLANRN